MFRWFSSVKNSNWFYDVCWTKIFRRLRPRHIIRFVWTCWLSGLSMWKLSLTSDEWTCTTQSCENLDFPLHNWIYKTFLAMFQGFFELIVAYENILFDVILLIQLLMDFLFICSGLFCGTFWNHTRLSLNKSSRKSYNYIHMSFPPFFYHLTRKSLR